MNMIERVAEAILNAGLPEDGSAVTRQMVGVENWKYAMRDAKAAIEAMREPTEAMIKAVTDQPACLECGYDVYDSKPERPWRVMIDVALEIEPVAQESVCATPTEGS